MQPIVITGGPGAGKSTLLAELAARGFTTFPEISRILIEQQSRLQQGILPWNDMPAFARLCLEMMSEHKQQALTCQVAFMDRAIPDICAYLQLAHVPVNTEFLSACSGYHRQALFCRPEPSIYVQDDVRPYPFSEALAIHDELENVYRTMGFEIINIPLTAVSARADYVIKRLNLSA